MAFVKIVRGTYGHWNGKAVVAKNSDSEPFELDEKKAQRIVDLGVAQYVQKEKALKAEGQPAEVESKIMEPDISELEKMTVMELKKIAGEYGIPYEKTSKKAELIQAIQSAAIPAEAPVFDATEAVIE